MFCAWPIIRMVMMTKKDSREALFEEWEVE